ncbi:GNAT family N-acetyltransferase [Halobaculum sp. MBLA0147]|uniref:GNAT family N-acetyltransferase n=1 Tax=Halobaculum sp. MBLA0147 TaxID=3079934 RepID=UPI0035265409
METEQTTVMFTLTRSSTHGAETSRNGEDGTDDTSPPVSLVAERPRVGRDGPAVRVRTARPVDREWLPEVHRAAVRARAAEAYDDEVLAAWGRERDPDAYDTDPDDGVFVVAERSGADRRGEGDEDHETPPVVGFGELVFDGGDHLDGVPETDAELRAVYVHPAVADRGVGSRLLCRLERTARRRDAPGVALHASLNAVGFYRRHGYERVRETTREFGTGVAVDVVEMRRTL